MRIATLTVVVLGVLASTLPACAAGPGILPVLAAPAVIAIAFQLLNHRFLAPINLTNLLLQVTSTGLIALGIYLVLLIGEIDLSVGSVGLPARPPAGGRTMTAAGRGSPAVFWQAGHGPTGQLGGAR
ncbi:MAG: D-xylose transport system permease protein [Micromonosporaceae bacterium]